MLSGRHRCSIVVVSRSAATRRQYTDVLGAQDRAVPGAELHVPLRATAAEAGLVAETLAAGTLAGVTVEVR
jgi:hypothetical protein